MNNLKELVTNDSATIKKDQAVWEDNELRNRKETKSGKEGWFRRGREAEQMGWFRTGKKVVI